MEPAGSFCEPKGRCAHARVQFNMHVLHHLLFQVKVHINWMFDTDRRIKCSSGVSQGSVRGQSGANSGSHTERRACWRGSWWWWWWWWGGGGGTQQPSCFGYFDLSQIHDGALCYPPAGRPGQCSLCVHVCARVCFCLLFTSCLCVTL